MVLWGCVGCHQIGFIRLRDYQFNCSTDALHQASVQNISDSTGPKKCASILPHHEDFRRRDRIASSMANTIATPGPLPSPSSQHHLRPSCSLVWPDSPYFTRNRTISIVQILLHGSHRSSMGEIGELLTCTWFFNCLSPHLSY